MATSSATTATMAPIASRRIPSASRTVLTPWWIRIRFNKGEMTVGPVTMMRVPNKMEILKSQFRKNRVDRVPPAIVTRAPIVMRPWIASCSRLIRLIRKFIPPSKRITATAKPTIMCSAEPRESGWIQFSPSGPNNRPAANKITMPGMCILRAMAWASIPRAMASPRVKAGLFAIHLRHIINKIGHQEGGRKVKSTVGNYVQTLREDKIVYRIMHPLY